MGSRWVPLHKQSINRLINQSITQSVKQSVSQSASQPTNQTRRTACSLCVQFRAYWVDRPVGSSSKTRTTSSSEVENFIVTGGRRLKIDLYVRRPVKYVFRQSKTTPTTASK